MSWHNIYILLAKRAVLQVTILYSPRARILKSFRGDSPASPLRI